MVEVRDMFYERRIRSFDGLMSEIRRLDSDSGVRVAGKYLKKYCFVFLTRFVGTYTVLVFERKGGKRPPLGARILSREFESAEALEVFLRQITGKEVEGYVY